MAGDLPSHKHSQSNRELQRCMRSMRCEQNPNEHRGFQTYTHAGVRPTVKTGLRTCPTCNHY